MSDPHIAAIIQARMSSTRLPGKVLADISGEPMLAWVVDRVNRAEELDAVIVATTINPADDPIVRLCEKRGYSVFRGDPIDVLDRYWRAARDCSAEIIVRVTADCPLLDPELVDQTVDALIHSQPKADFASNRLPWDRTYPIGLDVEVCTARALQRAWQEASEAHQREHVMPYIYEHPEEFRLLHLKAENDYGHLRWTVDTESDLKFIREVSKRLPDRIHFGWKDVLAIVEREPELMKINESVQHKNHLDVG